MQGNIVCYLNPTPLEYQLKLSISILLFVIVSMLPLPTVAQDSEETIITDQVWMDYYAYYYFKPKWEFYGDMGYRFTPKDLTWQTIHVRPSVRFIALALHEVQGGVGLFQTFNKDSPNSFELRPWQGYKLKWPSFEPVFFSHLVRMEERFFFLRGAPWSSISDSDTGLEQK